LFQLIHHRQEHLDFAHDTLMRHDEAIQDTEYKHQAVMHQLREELRDKQHQTELANQREYTMRAEREMKQKHNTETKQMPKHLKVFDWGIVGWAGP